MIKKITLNRFKKFKNHTVELRPFSVLTGENSSGKTTILQAIHLALGTLAGSDLLYEKNEKLQIKTKGVGATEFSGIPIEDFRELYYEKSSRQAKTSNTEGIGAFVNLEDNKKNVYKLQISSLFGGFNIRCVSAEEDILNEPEIYKYMPLLIVGGRGICKQEARYFPANLNQKIASGSQGEVIRNQVLELRRNAPDSYRKLTNCLAREFGLYLDKIAFEEQQDYYVQAMYHDCYGSNQLCLDYNSCGNGHLQILQILVPIYMLCPSTCRVVLIDQPEAYLHPGLQKKLLRVLQKLQRELNIQMILSTQSQTIVNQVSAENVVPVSAFNETSVPLTKEKEAGDMLRGIKNWDLAHAVISGKIVYIDEHDLNVWEAFDLVAGTNVFSGIHTVPVYMVNNTEDKTLFYMKALLTEFLGRDIDICYIKGLAGMRNYQREELKSYASQRGVKLHLMKCYEIENYLLSDELILHTLEELYPQKEKPTFAQVSEKITAALKESTNQNQNDLGADALLEDYMQYGSGKDALETVIEWILSEWNMELCVEDLLNHLQYQDVSDDIIDLLLEVRSNCYMSERGEDNIYGEEKGEELEESSKDKSKQALKQTSKQTSSEDEVIQLTLPF